jgi:hypothetical protein
MKLRLFVIGAICLGACGSPPPAKRALNEREKDSVIGASRLPGAAGVRGAMRASDSASARRARADSVTRDRADSASPDE